MAIVVRDLIEEDHEVYIKFLESIEYSLLYSSLRYKAFLDLLIEGRSRYLIALSEGEVRAVLPLVYLNGPHGTVINSLPFYGSNGGILASCCDCEAALKAAYREIVLSSGIAASTLIQNPLSAASEENIPYDHKDFRLGFFTDLSGMARPEVELVSRIDGSARRNIKRAAKSGVEVKVTPASESLEFLMATHQDNMMAIGGRYKQEAFATALVEAFSEGQDFKIYTAAINGRIVAALLVFYFNKVVEYYMPAIIHEFRQEQPLAGILATAMSEAAKEGYLKWNWGGCWGSQVSLQRFKRKWGGEEYRYDYLTKVNEPTLYQLLPGELSAVYPDFFVLPYDQLNACEVRQKGGG
ncbi:GNAT family N-acetyltransferase [Kiloniella sp.]|uniref:GNAT family N-acetyltransferase n=1 Tax=Kiloniella sp. TaxID=1938587 RepID=UPI003A8F995B